MAEPLGSKIGSAFIEVGASFIGFGKGLAADVTNAFLAQSFVVGQALENFGQAVFTKFSLPLIAATGANIAQFQALDKEIRTVLTLFGTAPSLVDDTIGEMAAGIREVSLEVGGLEREIGEGLYQTISAGVPEAGAFEFLEVAQMAAIADRTADLTTAVDGLTTVVNAFGLEASDATQIADVMFQTVALGKTTFGELSSDIGRVAPLAANAGVEFQELFSIIGTLTLGGLKTSEAISFLRASITGVLRPTEELNEIFQNLGFASAEAAIPVLGLQGAFSAVVDAAGGSTAKLQELIGTSEGVSAILGVTGDNAAKFERTMEGVSNSTGAATRAFEIMDESVSRSFGKLTEAFDRLGNTFGEMGSQFAQPVVDAITGVINSMVTIFSQFRPIVSGLSEAFGGFIGLLQAPIIREIVAIFAALGTTVFGLIGSLGLLSLTLGKVILAGLQIKAVSTAFRGLNIILGFSRLAIQGIGESMLTAAARMRAGGTAAKLAATPIRGLGTAFTSTRFATLAAVGTFGLVAAAITGAVAGIGFLISKQKEYVESQELFRKGVDTLIESLDLVNQEIILEGAEEGESNMAEFLKTNRENLLVLRETSEELGELAAIDVLEAIAAELVWRGNSPEEAIAAVNKLAEAAGIEIDIETADLEQANFQIEQFIEGLRVTADRLGGPRGLTAGANDTANALATLFEKSFATGDQEAFIEGIEAIGESIDENIDPRNRQATFRRLKNALNDIFEEEYGFKLLGFLDDSENVVDPEFILRRLAEEGLSIPVGIDLEAGPEDVAPEIPSFGGVTPFNLFPIEGEEALPEFGDLLDDVGLRARELGISLQTAFSLGEEGRETFQQFAQGIETLFDDAKQSVIDAMDEIRGQVQSQNPLLDIYQGHIKQSFDEWSEGQQRFRDELEDVTNLRERLVGDKSIPEAVLEAFDAAPLSKQAWLAHLSPENLDAALEELTLTQEAIDEASAERIAQSFTDIIEDVRSDIQAKYVELAEDARAEGPVVADAFNEAFGTAAENWETTTETMLTAVRTQISEADIPGPTITDIKFPDFSDVALAEDVENLSTSMVTSLSTANEEGSGQLEALGDTTNLVVDGMVITLNDIPSRVNSRSIGSSIKNGVLGGLSGLSSGIVNRMRAQIDAALARIRGIYGIRSPSKVFADAVGRPIAEGIALGIDDGGSVIRKALDGSLQIPSSGVTPRTATARGIEDRTVNVNYDIKLEGTGEPVIDAQRVSNIATVLRYMETR